MEQNGKIVWGGALILGLSIVVGTLVVAVTMYKVKSLSNTISVTGSAEKYVTSDMAKWTSNFTMQTGPDNLKWGTTEMKRQLAVVMAYLNKNGVSSDQITVQPVTVSQFCMSNNSITYDKYGNQSCGSGGVQGYNLQQALVVETSDVQKVKSLSQDAVSTLVNQGVLFNNQGVEYYFNKLQDVRVELLAEATRDAQTRASKIAESTGQSIGTIQSASMGVIQVTARNSIDFSDYGSYDTSVIDKKVTAVVRAGFTVR